MVAQEQALATNIIKNRIHHFPISPLCRLCYSSDETVNHLISGCSHLVQSHYKPCHDQVAFLVHWQLCMSVGINVAGNWWNHTPERVVSNFIRMQWDYVTDRYLCHNRPDIVLSYLQQKKTYLIDISIPEWFRNLWRID